jgi:hypothetical protein
MSSDHTPPREGWKDLKRFVLVDNGRGYPPEMVVREHGAWCYWPSVEVRRTADTEAHQQEIEKLKAELADSRANHIDANERNIEANNHADKLEADLATLRQERDRLADRLGTTEGALALAQHSRDQLQTEHTRLREALEIASNTAGDLRSGFAKSVDPARWVEQFQAHCGAALAPPVATPQEPERCVWRRLPLSESFQPACEGENFDAARNEYDLTGWRHCPNCGRPLTVAAPQEEP